MEQLLENTETAEEAVPGSLTEEESALIAEARDAYRARTLADCTECRYCLPCPSDVDIPAVIAFLNDAALYDDVDGSRTVYNLRLRDTGKASLCTECGTCEELCPQGLPIIDLMRQGVDRFEG